MESDRESDLLQAEDGVLSAVKTLLQARNGTDQGPLDADRLAVLAQRHGLDARLVRRLWSILNGEAGSNGLGFDPYIQKFKPYADKDKKNGGTGEDDLLDLSNNENPLGASARVVGMLRDKTLWLSRYPPLSDYRLRE